MFSNYCNMSNESTRCEEDDMMDEAMNDVEEEYYQGDSDDYSSDDKAWGGTGNDD